jgi:hypothetical protein
LLSVVVSGVEHAAARFLDLVLQIGDGAEAVDQPWYISFGVVVRAPLIAVLRGRGHRAPPRAAPGGERAQPARGASGARGGERAVVSGMGVMVSQSPA